LGQGWGCQVKKKIPLLIVSKKDKKIALQKAAFNILGF
jgi:hypothetical protein